MSGIAKPMTHFTNSLKPTIKIPVEQVISVEKQDISANPNGPSSTAQYLLVFGVLDAANAPVRYIKVPFATANLRNTSFTNYTSAFSTATA
jgi:hypothetical protein